jgi:protein involved in polysaccharide export with SLBB domain
VHRGAAATKHFFNRTGFIQPMRASISRTLIVWAVVAIAAVRVDAQSRIGAGAYATRTELETIATEYARRAADATRNTNERAESRSEERALRDRLRTGDFRVGDRIVLRISGGASVLDTLSVTASRAIAIPEAGEIGLDGVLRSELQQHLNAQLSRYLRNAVVRAEPLTRLAVLGEVRTPGFVHVPSQALLSDVLSAAGGPTASGSLDRVTVRRNGETFISSGTFAKALARGETLDGLDLRAGDEIVVDRKRAFNWTQMFQTTAIVVGSVATIVAIQSR